MTHGRAMSAASRWLRSAAWCALAALPLAHAQDAGSLKARHASLREALADNQFHRPLHLESSEAAGVLTGEIYALIDQSYATVGPALQGMDHWCDVLILHLNVKACHAGTTAAGNTLSLNIGRKFDQPLADSYRFEFLYEEASRPGYMSVVMTAAEGPLNTSHYRILLEMSELDAQRSFLHLTYSYTQGFAARIATQIYLATVGHSKIGFTIVGRTDAGQPVFIGGTRGVIERNAMRCYLAIEAYLGALSTPLPGRIEKRLNDWHAGIERYPLQLHEIALDEYLAMKHREIPRNAASRTDVRESAGQY
jgi:hypothetical protein